MTQTASPDPIEVGDTVTIGDATLDWLVLDIEHFEELPLDLPPANNDLALLRSGQTGRRREEPVRNLKIWSPTA